MAVQNKESGMEKMTAEDRRIMEQISRILRQEKDITSEEYLRILELLREEE